MTRDRDRPRLRQEWVSTLYLDLLHGNGFDATHGRATAAAARQASRALDADDLAALLAGGGWRERLVAGWLAGIGEHRPLIPTLSALLLASETCYAGQGYCAALAMMPGTPAANALITYLDRYLPRPDLEYDQRWALVALRVIDDDLGTAHAIPYSGPAWSMFCDHQRRAPAWGLPALGSMIAWLREADQDPSAR